MPLFAALPTAAEMLGLVLCGSLSAYLLWITANNLKVDFEVRLIFVGGMVVAVFCRINGRSAAAASLLPLQATRYSRLGDVGGHSMAQG